jgi:hypothetical protein
MLRLGLKVERYMSMQRRRRLDGDPVYERTVSWLGQVGDGAVWFVVKRIH